jgi:hypothetical protein
MASVICDILRSLEVKQPKCKKVIYHRWEEETLTNSSSVIIYNIRSTLQKVNDNNNYCLISKIICPHLSKSRTKVIGKNHFLHTR